MTRAPGPLTLFAILLVVATGPAQAQSTPYVRDAMAELRRAVESQPGQTHLSRMFALRRLRDDGLAPVYRRLLAHKDWPMQVHGALGLAELAAPPALDAAHVALVAPEAQEPLIANAIDMDLANERVLNSVLAIENLEPFPRLLVTAELVLAGQEPDISALRSLSDSEDNRIALFARLLLTEFGASDLPSLNERIDPRSARERRAMTQWLLEVIRQYSLTASLPFVQELLAAPNLDPMTRHQALRTALRIDRATGLALWSDHLGSDPPRYADRVRFALLLLAADVDEDASWNRLTTDLPDTDELIRAMRSVASSSHQAAPDRAEAYLRLLDLAHPASSEWAMTALAEEEAEVTTAVYGSLIDQGPTRAGAAARVALAVEAATRLYLVDPNAVLRRLASAPDDSEAQEVLILSLLDYRDARIAATVMEIPRSTAGRADSLTVVLLARNAPTLNPDDRNRLAIIASGGGLVSEGLQTQAAWLFLGHEGAHDQALRSLGAVD